MPVEGQHLVGRELSVYDTGVCIHRKVCHQLHQQSLWLLCLGSRALWIVPEAVPADDNLGVSRLFGRQCQDVLEGLESGARKPVTGRNPCRQLGLR